ncbi:hypothetical protein CDD83_4252 [Cordyceps sp. RAO-2017]|nr:hypothetical protein CDD83_4252 [Cordyceps sp. RAO-2017]
MPPPGLWAVLGLAATALATTLAGSSPATASDELAGTAEERFESPPYYPAPYGGWDASWAVSYREARAVVAGMTLAEKTNLTSGTGIFMG